MPARGCLFRWGDTLQATAPPIANMPEKRSHLACRGLTIYRQNRPQTVLRRPRSDCLRCSCCCGMRMTIGVGSCRVPYVCFRFLSHSTANFRIGAQPCVGEHGGHILVPSILRRRFFRFFFFFFLDFSASFSASFLGFFPSRNSRVTRKGASPPLVFSPLSLAARPVFSIGLARILLLPLDDDQPGTFRTECPLAPPP